MKTIYLRYLLLLVFISTSCSEDDDYSNSSDDGEMEMTPMEEERTAIPDPLFEAYLVDRNYDDVVDGSVLTAGLLNVQQIVVDDLGISDLTGIEDCPNLNNLWLQNCNVSQLNVSNNPLLKFIYFDNNNITSISVTALPLLEKLSGRNNGLSVVNVSSNPELELLEISGNDIDDLDVSQNTALFRLDVTGNPLTCVQANQDQIDATTLMWTLDDDDTLSIDCD